jgi:hypothetical protein
MQIAVIVHLASELLLSGSPPAIAWYLLFFPCSCFLFLTDLVMPHAYVFDRVCPSGPAESHKVGLLANFRVRTYRQVFTHNHWISERCEMWSRQESLCFCSKFLVYVWWWWWWWWWWRCTHSPNVPAPFRLQCLIFQIALGAVSRICTVLNFLVWGVMQIHVCLLTAMSFQVCANMYGHHWS